MTFSISGSVGGGGKNRIHDVAKMQAAFTAIGFQRKKYAVDGKMNSFDVAVGRYIEANPVKVNGNRNYPSAIEPKGQIIESLRKALKGSTVEKLEAIPGTIILYEPIANNRGNDKDYLIPPFLSLPRDFMSGGTNYRGYIDRVEIPNTSAQFKFVVTMSLGYVGRFWDPKSQRLIRTAPAQMKAFIDEQLRRDGKGWTYLPPPKNISHFRLQSVVVPAIDSIINKLSSLGGSSRIVWDDLKKSYRIPPKDKILEIAGRIHAETCAATGEAGGKAVNKPWADYAATVLERSLNRNVVVGNERHCDSCQTLAILVRYNLTAMIAFREKQQVISNQLNAFIWKNSNDADVERARDIFKKAGSNLIPIVGDAIFGIEHSAQEMLINDAKSMTEMVIDLQAKWGRDKKYLQLLMRLLTLVNAAIAAAAVINLGAELIIKAFKDGKIQEATLKAQRDLYNIQLEYDQAELLELRAKRDFDARNCQSWGYLYNE